MKLAFNHTTDVVSLYNIGASQYMGKLGYTCHISDLIIHKENEESKLLISHLVQSGKLSVISSSSKEMETIGHLYTTYCSIVSVEDFAICYFAKTQKAVLVTNEIAMQELADELEVEHTSTSAILNKLLIFNTG